jgi:hypothetical protein
MLEKKPGKELLTLKPFKSSGASNVYIDVRTWAEAQLPLPRAATPTAIPRTFDIVSRKVLRRFDFIDAVSRFPKR